MENKKENKKEKYKNQTLIEISSITSQDNYIGNRIERFLFKEFGFNYNLKREFVEPEPQQDSSVVYTIEERTGEQHGTLTASPFAVNKPEVE